MRIFKQFTISSFAFFVAAVLVASGFSGRAAAQEGLSEEGSTPQALSLVDLLSLPGLEEPRLSPSGNRVAFLKEISDWERNRRIEHIWIANRAQEERFQLTNGKGGESSPRWSPDGSQIAFLADRSDTLETQIHLIRPDGGEARRFTSHPTEVSDIQWSPEGRWIYYRAKNEKTEAEKAEEKAGNDVFAFNEDYQHRHLWRVDVESGETTQLTNGNWSVIDYHLGRSGDRVVYHRSPTPLLDDMKEWEVWVASATGEEPKQVTGNAIPEYDARLSPDGSRILFRADANEDFQFYYNSNLFVAPVNGGAPRLLLKEMPYEVDGASWASGGDAIFFSANTGARQELFRVGLESEQRARLTEGKHSIGDWTYHPDLDRHVFTVETPKSPGDVWTMGCVPEFLDQLGD